MRGPAPEPIWVDVGTAPQRCLHSPDGLCQGYGQSAEALRAKASLVTGHRLVDGRRPSPIGPDGTDWRAGLAVSVYRAAGVRGPFTAIRPKTVPDVVLRHVRHDRLNGADVQAEQRRRERDGNVPELVAADHHQRVAGTEAQSALRRACAPATSSPPSPAGRCASPRSRTGRRCGADRRNRRGFGRARCPRPSRSGRPSSRPCSWWAHARHSQRGRRRTRHRSGASSGRPTAASTNCRTAWTGRSRPPASSGRVPTRSRASGARGRSWRSDDRPAAVLGLRAAVVRRGHRLLCRTRAWRPDPPAGRPTRGHAASDRQKEGSSAADRPGGRSGSSSKSSRQCREYYHRRRASRLPETGGPRARGIRWAPSVQEPVSRSPPSPGAHVRCRPTGGQPVPFIHAFTQRVSSLPPSLVLAATVPVRDLTLARARTRATCTSPRTSLVPGSTQYVGGTRPPGARSLASSSASPATACPSACRRPRYLSYDDEHLYVVFVCKDDPAKVRANLTKREAIIGDDVVGVLLDTYHDGRRAYMFIANPARHPVGRRRRRGPGRRLQLRHAVAVGGPADRDGYVVLFAIPFKSLRFSNDDVQTWGLALARDHPTRERDVVLAVRHAAHRQPDAATGDGRRDRAASRPAATCTRFRTATSRPRGCWRTDRQPCDGSTPAVRGSTRRRSSRTPSRSTSPSTPTSARSSPTSRR